MIKELTRGSYKVAVNVAMWVEHRLQLVKLWEQTAGHPVPKSTGSWFYALGSMTITIFAIQLLTGVLLALVYNVSGSEAYHSLEVLNYEVPFGWFVRATHYWGSNVMVLLVFFHMLQVFLWGAFKYPREMTWVSGVLLLFMTLGMAFSGQVLRYDADSYWGVGIGCAVAGRIPFIGDYLVHLLLGGPIIGDSVLSRFFALHVFIIPGTILALLGVHLRLVLSRGINEVPTPGILVNRKTYEAYYKEIIRREGVPFVPGIINKDLVASGLVILLVILLAVFAGPKGPGIPVDPTITISEAKPDYPFLWLFSAAALMPNGSETLLFFVLPTIGVLFIFALPFIANEGEKSFRRRPVSVMIVVVAVIGIGMLTIAGMTGPWSPQMEAWKALPIKKQFIQARSPLELQGALVFQNKQCRGCHAIAGQGGHRGPDLTAVATRQTAPQLTRQIYQGGGNMPAYGKNLSTEEVTALVAYLSTLHPKGEKAAQEAAGVLPPGERAEKKSADRKEGLSKN